MPKMLEFISLTGNVTAKLPFKQLEQAAALKARLEKHTKGGLLRYYAASTDFLQEGRLLADEAYVEPDKQVTVVRQTESRIRCPVELPEQYLVRSFLRRQELPLSTGNTNSVEYLAEDLSQTPVRKAVVTVINNYADDPQCGKRILRDVKLLGAVRHQNLMSLYDLCGASVHSKSFCMVRPYMDMDLEKVIYLTGKHSKTISNANCQAFTAQMLRGLKYLHSAGIVHGDLRPSNCLLNSKDFTLRLANFGHCRAEDNAMTFAHRIRVDSISFGYLAPENILAANLEKAIDLWALGCIHSELLMQKPLFLGSDPIRVLKLHIAALGFSSERDLAWVNDCIVAEGINPDYAPSEAGLMRFIGSLKPDAIQRRPLRERILGKGIEPGTAEMCLDFLHKLLVFNPQIRMNAEDALDHAYLAHLHDPEGESVAETQFSWDFEECGLADKGSAGAAYDSKLSLQARIAVAEAVIAECARFHPEILPDDKQSGELAENSAELAKYPA